MKRCAITFRAVVLALAALLVACTSGTTVQPQTKSAIACTLCIIPSPNSSQQSNDLSGVAALAANDVWAVGHYFDYSNYKNHRYALIEHWNGTQWSIVASPQPGEGFNDLTSIAAVGPTDIWAVGSYIGSGFQEYTLTEHWDGSRWSVIYSPSFTDQSKLISVTTIGPRDIWAVGTSTGIEEPNQTLIEHWNGQRWSIVPKGNSIYNGLSAVSALASDNVWAAGGNNLSDNPYLSGSQGLIQHWNGTAWSAMSTPNSFRESSLFGIAAVSANNVYAVGNYQDATSHKFYPLIEQWDGQSWHVVASPSPRGSTANNLMSLAVVAPDDIWAVGTTYTSGDAFQKVLVEHWNGQQWSVVVNPNRGKESHLNAIAPVPNSPQLWSVGGSTNNLNNPRDFTGQTLIERYR